MGRISAAVNSIVSTIVNVITLPFRVLGKLLGGRRRRRNP
ncbi:LPFR motif small protein [Actinomadura flavalba]|nr:LPFR motif small protein [Actinomadura flavalba]